MTTGPATPGSPTRQNPSRLTTVYGNGDGTFGRPSVANGIEFGLDRVALGVDLALLEQGRIALYSGVGALDIFVGLALWQYLRRIHLRVSDKDDNDATV